MPYIVTTREYERTPIKDLDRKIRIHIQGKLANVGGNRTSLTYAENAMEVLGGFTLMQVAIANALPIREYIMVAD